MEVSRFDSCFSLPRGKRGSTLRHAHDPNNWSCTFFIGFLVRIGKREPNIILIFRFSKQREIPPTQTIMRRASIALAWGDESKVVALSVLDVFVAFEYPRSSQTSRKNNKSRTRRSYDVPTPPVFRPRVHYAYQVPGASIPVHWGASHQRI